VKYTTDWRDDGPGAAVITPGGIGVMRLLGTPFAAAGLWFLYQFLGGVLHPSEMTVFGWIILPVLAAVFLVPGWIILFGRKRTRLDATRREAIEEFDLLVFTRRKPTAIPREAHVLLRYEKGGSETNYPAHVYLDSGGGLILLTMFGSKEKAAALAFAHRIAGLFGIDVQDRCFERGEVTAGGVVVDRLGPEDAD
jgi:hypothetical protein